MGLSEGWTLEPITKVGAHLGIRSGQAITGLRSLLPPSTERIYQVQLGREVQGPRG